MSNCKECGSFAINEHLHGREPGVDLDLCDVCYWRKRAVSCGCWECKSCNYINKKSHIRCNYCGELYNFKGEVK